MIFDPNKKHLQRFPLSLSLYLFSFILSTVSTYYWCHDDILWRYKPKCGKYFIVFVILSCELFFFIPTLTWKFLSYGTLTTIGTNFKWSGKLNSDFLIIYHFYFKENMSSYISFTLSFINKTPKSAIQPGDLKNI